jgi:asparagine synthase (glutamine-hydrolysing)
MCDTIRYRGPDGSGYYNDKNVSLGMRRLAIIDVKRGKQPQFNEDGDAAIVFNGEIYNHRDLRPALERQGHKFKTHSDTETIIHSYEEHGADTPKFLRGMFAFAIHDRKKNKLLLARDRFGKKPLYYAKTKRGLVFGSEIKTLLLHEDVSREIDNDAVRRFLRYRFIPGPQTIFKQVKKLPPGSTLTADKNGIKIQKYWNAADYATEQESRKSVAINEVRHLLVDAVRSRLESEVSLGAYLSGGVDSSSVVAIMARSSETPVKTFSVGFGVEKYDELPFARETAEFFGTDHEEVVVEPREIKHLPKIIWHLDEPMADPTAIPTYLLSQRAKRKVTVVLTGEGGDELFAGYEQYKFLAKGEKYGKWIPGFVREKLLPSVAKNVPKDVLDKLFKYASALGEKGLERATMFARDVNEPQKAYLDLVSIFTEKELRDVAKKNGPLAKGFTEEATITPAFQNSKSAIMRAQLFEIETSLPDDLLMKVDKTAMAWSIEARAPLLDQLLAEYALKLHPSLKIRNGVEKYALRKAAEPMLPPSVRKRGKARFYVPLDYWFGGELKEFASQVLDAKTLKKRGWFDSAGVSKILSNYETSKAYVGRQAWSLITLELWSRVFTDQDYRASPDVRFEKLMGRGFGA